jgi:hypothetical protein
VQAPQPNASRKQLSQIGNNAIDKIKHTLQRWEQRLTVENPNFVERYKKGNLQLLLEFSTGLIPKKYVIFFQGANCLVGENYPRVRFSRTWKLFGIQARQMHSNIRSNNGDRESVFIDNAQAVQTPENIPIPSLVWLNSADRIYNVLPHSLYLSKTFGFVFRGAVGYREINFAFSGVGAAPERARQIIQGGSSILNDVACDGEDCRSDWLYARDVVRCSALRINTALNCVWPTPYEFGDLDFKILEVMVGPFDFDAD